MSHRWQDLVDSPNTDRFFTAYNRLKKTAEPHEWADWGQFLLDDAWMLSVRSMMDYHSHRTQWISFLHDYTEHMARSEQHGTHYSIQSLYSQLLQNAAKYSEQHFRDFVNHSLPKCWSVCEAARCGVRELIAFYGEDALDVGMVVFDHVDPDDLLAFFCDNYSPNRLMFDRWAVEGFAKRLEFSPRVCDALAQCALFAESADLRQAWEENMARNQRNRLSAVVATAERMSVRKL